MFSMCVGVPSHELHIPLDRKAGHSRLFGKDIAPHMIHNWLGWWLGAELCGVVFVVDVVPNPDKFPSVVAASKEDDSHAENLRCRNPLQVGGIRFKDELVDANWDRTNEKRVKLLIVLGSGVRLSERSGEQEVF